ncbi:MAG: hypothetical protein HQK58_03815 [Deltaproteobacteria bacterium]|nr:hypothetical protein [Deltaproteobacteria bacterium]
MRLQKIITTLFTLAFLLCCLSSFSESQIYPAHVLKTGQTKASSRLAGDDGDLQTGAPWPNPGSSITEMGRSRITLPD